MPASVESAPALAGLASATCEADPMATECVERSPDQVRRVRKRMIAARYDDDNGFGDLCHDPALKLALGHRDDTRRCCRRNE